MLGAGCADDASSAVTGGTADGKADKGYDALVRVLDEFKFDDLVDHPETQRLEPSGVAATPDGFVVVFDNVRDALWLDAPLEFYAWEETSLDSLRADDEVDDVRDLVGFEGVAYDAETGTVSLLVEALKNADGKRYPLVLEVAQDGETSHTWWKHKIDASNNGAEGLTFLELDGVRYSVAICETGKCDGSQRGRMVLREDGSGPMVDVDLPKGLEFGDYSGIAARGNRLAVISQESSRIWTGWITLTSEGWKTNTEKVWGLPKDDGRTVYCSLEGVDWLDDSTLVAVSDQEKADQPSRCRHKAESIHFFSLDD